MRPLSSYGKDELTRRNKADVLIYDRLSRKAKNQLYHLWNSFFAQPRIRDEHRRDAWKIIHKSICEEIGVKNSLTLNNKTYQGDVETYFDEETDVLKLLLVFEAILFSAKILDSMYHLQYSFSELVEDVNTRLVENNVGYRYLSERIIKVDNDLITEQIVMPALNLLQDPLFKNANEEFLNAFEHFKRGRNKECLVDCLKAIESSLKIICVEKRWPFKNTDTVKTLIDVVLKNELVPSFLQNHFTGIRQILESSAPTIRNKMGGHGQGVNKIIVPDYVAAYMIDITASSVIFFVSAAKEKGKS